MGKANSRVRKTIVNTFAGIINQFLNIFLNFALRTAFIKTIGIQYTGVSSVFSSILTMLSLSELGFGTAVATALYKPLKENDTEQIQKLMYFYKVVYRYVACIIFIIGILLIPFLDTLITDVPDVVEDIRIIYIFYIIRTAVSYLMIYKSTILKADQKLYVVKSFEMLCNFLRYLIEIICLIVFKKFIIYLIIEVVANIIQNYVITKRAEKEYPYAFKQSQDKLSKENKKIIWKSVKGLSMYKISASVGNSIDTILISSYISTTTVGLFSNYTMIRHQLDGVIKQLYTAVIPSIGNLAAEKDNKKQLVVFYRLFYISFLMVNFCSTSLFVLFNPFIEWWLGERFLLGKEIAFIVAVDFFLYILLQSIASFRTANGVFVKGQYRPLITAILNVFLSVILIKRYNIFGTILATVLCRLLTQWYDPYVLFKSVFHDKFYKFYCRYWYYIFVFLSGALITNRMAVLVEVQNVFLNVVIRMILCVIVPNLWVLIFSFKSSEFKYVFSMFVKKVGKGRKG